MDVCQFWLLKMICPFAFITGLTVATFGNCAIASASACVSDCAVPPPCLTLPALLALLALPGILGNTTPNDYRVNKQLQMMKFNGERWELFGPILEDSGPAG